jgi:hypothetical protein
VEEPSKFHSGSSLTESGYLGRVCCEVSRQQSSHVSNWQYQLMIVLRAATIQPTIGENAGWETRDERAKSDSPKARLLGNDGGTRNSVQSHR